MPAPTGGGAGRITILGAGGIGGCVAAELALAGEPVTLVDRYAPHVEEVRRAGLRCDGVLGDHRIDIDRVETWEELIADETRGPLETVLLAVKSQDTRETVEMLLPLLDEGSVVVSLQNGWNPREIATVVGAQRTIAAMVHMVGNYNGPGHVTRYTTGQLFVGEMHGTVTPRLGELARRLSKAVPTQTTANVWGYIWSKQVYATTFPATALVDEPDLEIVQLDWVQDILLALIVEAMAVADAEGVKLERYDHFDPARFRLRRRADLMAARANLPKGSPKGNSGMWLDLKKGRRKTEVDYLSGELVRIGRRHGLPSVVNERVVAMIAEIESGQRTMSRDNLAGLVESAREVIEHLLIEPAAT